MQMIDGHRIICFEERLKWVPVHQVVLCPSIVHSKLFVISNLGPISASSRLWLHLFLVSVHYAGLKIRLSKHQSLHDHREHLLYS
jgi:hypothetical protein